MVTDPPAFNSRTEFPRVNAAARAAEAATADQAATPAAPPSTVWVATEFSIDDGGRAWIQAASTCETAKRLCVEHLNRDGDPTKPRTLTWSDDRAAKWMFGQDTEAAHVDGHDYYEVRRVEVTD
jgi:hypothetical protein